MNVLIVTTPSHQILQEQYFQPTLPPGTNILEKKLSSNQSGDYLSKQWQEGVTAKLKWALEYAQANEGAVFVLSDVDIQFFPAFSWAALESEFAASGADVLFQKESSRSDSNEVNTGFYIVRSTPYFATLMQKAIAECEAATTRNDQVALNAILDPNDLGKRWGFLSLRYYSRSQGFPPARDIVLHHATMAYTIAQKASQLRQVRRAVLGGAVGRGMALAQEFGRYVFSGRLLGMLKRKILRK
jgi:hypothetical protein